MELKKNEVVLLGQNYPVIKGMSIIESNDLVVRIGERCGYYHWYQWWPL